MFVAYVKHCRINLINFAFLAHVALFQYKTAQYTSAGSPPIFAKKEKKNPRKSINRISIFVVIVGSPGGISAFSWKSLSVDSITCFAIATANLRKEIQCRPSV